MLPSSAAYQETWETTKQEFNRTRDADRVLASRTAAVDKLVCAAWGELVAGQAPAGLVLLAVGGYGRRQLFPYSDVDLLLLFETDRAAESSRTLISPFLQQLWDSGLRVSQSVRTTAECAALHDRNVELNVSLLDARFLAGDAPLAEKLAAILARFAHAQRQPLVRNLARLTRERHLKYLDTIYHLEPNIKETPGGLRDYQLLCWLGQLKNTTPLRLGEAGGNAELDAARRFLFSLRCYLHYQAGRDSNALSYEAQEEAAELAGRPAAAWMREYFRHAREMYRAATRLLEASEAQSASLFVQFRDWRSRVSNVDFAVLRERLFFKSPQQIEADPWLVLRCFEMVARHGIRLSQDAERRIAANLHALRGYFAEPRSLWPVFSRILSLPRADLALAAMHETGVLTSLFPEHEEIECLVIRDYYHRYTVDEHTLIAIRTVSRLRDSRDAAAKPYAELLAELDTPAVLYFALLFHDVGKGSAGEGHVDAGLRLAEAAMERIQMPETDRETVRFLIRRHLDLSETMSSRDMGERATIESLAHRLGTLERLKALTLLTYGDISAVNPAAMTPWRSQQLFRLYRLTYNELTAKLDTERIEGPDAGSPGKAAFLEGFPTRYLYTHTPQQIDRHLALDARAAERGVALELKKDDAVWHLTLLTSDRPGLFASVAGTLSSFGMNILKAEAFANRRGAVLDTFAFADPLRTLELNPPEIDRLQATLERVILEKQDVRELLRNRPKNALPSRGVRLDPAVSFDSTASQAATLIQIVCEDRPGLLYDLASAMSAQSCNIEVVLIDTEAHKAIDVFYVTSGGAKLSQELIERLRERLLEVCKP